MNTEKFSVVWIRQGRKEKKRKEKKRKEKRKEKEKKRKGGKKKDRSLALKVYDTGWFIILVFSSTMRSV